MKKTGSGFTLVEIMIVVAIIALLAAIAIPNLLRAKLSANDALAKATIRAVSTASESYGTANNGNYPLEITSLTGATPPFLSVPFYCGLNISGFIYNCSFDSTGYTISADPIAIGSSGSTTYTISTGGVLTP